MFTRVPGFHDMFSPLNSIVWPEASPMNCTAGSVLVAGRPEKPGTMGRFKGFLLKSTLSLLVAFIFVYCIMFLWCKGPFIVTLNPTFFWNEPGSVLFNPALE